MIKMAKNNKEKYDQLESKAKKLEALIHLCNKIREGEKRAPVPFNDFLYLVSESPEHVFRDIYQFIYDMIHYYIPDGDDEYETTKDSIGFKNYDTSNLLVEGCDNPFFADRLFANRLINLAQIFRQGTQNNRIYIFEGPPGSGKSTFLNNFLSKIEEYAKTDEGTTYKTYWRLDVEKLGGFTKIKRKLLEIGKDGKEHEKEAIYDEINTVKYPNKYLEFSCPNHDHPILQIPKELREQFLDELITDENFKERLFTEKQYKWVLKDQPCSICNSIYKSLIDITKDPLEVFGMIAARKNYFNRQLGEGISVFNPGDPPINKPLKNEQLQHLLDDLLQHENVNYTSSYLSKTNNGVLALMDIKEHNVERLKNYHGIISDGIHKVELTEEKVKTFFMGLVNPEDKVHYEKVQSFQDRIVNVKIPYVLDYNTEVSIFKSKFGEKIEQHFLPRVLQNFAKIIISSRMDKASSEIRRWIKNPDKYQKYNDKNLLLLKMEVYTGKIPSWLNDEDVKAFDKVTRKNIVAASEFEGTGGISGRRSLMIFNTFYSKYFDENKPITMECVREFFQKEIKDNNIPVDFIDKLVDLYDYNVLQEVKESVFYYNEAQISRDIMNYLFALNYDIGDVKKSDYTRDVIDISEDYLVNIEKMFIGNVAASIRNEFRQEQLNEYITTTLAQEIRVHGKDIKATEQFNNLYTKYTKNLKENSLAPYIDNENFRRAIQDFGTKAYEKYDYRLRRDVEHLFKNLHAKYLYTKEGAREVSLYVLDKDLIKKY
jgi:hypothetical protein